MLKSSHCLTQRCSWNTVFSHNMSQLSIFIVKFSYVDIHTHTYIYDIYTYTHIHIYIYDIWLHTGLTCVSRQRVLPRFGWLTDVSQLRDLNSQREWCEQCFKPPLVDSSGIILHTYIIIYIYLNINVLMNNSWTYRYKYKSINWCYIGLYGFGTGLYGFNYWVI